MKYNKGFTLLTAVVVTSMLLLVSFVVADIALKQLILAYAGQDSEYSFYNADSGLECAEYWDLKNPSGTSSFATSTPGTVTCNGQIVTTNSENNVPTSPIQSSLIGNGANTIPSTPTSVFYINYTHGCAVVFVTKNNDGTTLVESRGYNTCDVNAVKRYERGIRLTY